ncbi:MAG TPA: R3H domain-containing nucleic acid-binding protein, partial [Candidatus Binataceae bacterium]|nr:R3H domain-containing nucleic acid-binding protein [Candidatus Binataceae bacterium]
PPRREVMLDEQGDINGNVALPESAPPDLQPRRDRQPRSGPPPAHGQGRRPRPNQGSTEARGREPEAEDDDRGNRREDANERPAVHREPAEIESQAREGCELLAKILELMGEQATVSILHPDPEGIELELKGDGSGILIGRHGQTLDALEYVVNRVLARKTHDAIPILLETESYRDRRRQQLQRMALSMGERAKRDHAPVRLEPMPPRDRRVIHLALKDDPMVTTRSSGEGFLRSVEIVPTDTRGRGERGGGGGGGRGRRRNEPRQPAVGEQGGFARGQKRIV